jgi:nicotinamide-nucleotide amidase
MLPGVPREMRGMLADSLLPRIRERIGAEAGTVVRSLTLRTTGFAESMLADRIDSMDGGPLGASLAYLPSATGVDLRLTVRDLSSEDADEALRAASGRLRARLGDWIYGEQTADLAAIVLEMCRARKLTIAVAESCTGGLLGARLTAISGSSEVVMGGVIAYHNDVKHALLGVDAAVLREHGAVSEPVVLQMATGARRAVHASVGLAITGIAGPTGGTPEKPVGTVWVAVDLEGVAEARLFKLIGDRDEIRQRAAQWAMEMLRKRLLP